MTTGTTARLDALMAEVAALRTTASLLDWDERVCMPQGGVAMHGEMLAVIRRLAHEKFASDETGRLLEEARAEASGLGESDSVRTLEITSRDYQKATRVPAAFVAEQAVIASAAHQAWREAREQSSYAIFEPHLRKIVELRQRYIEFFKPLDHPYDALLDDFEPGMLPNFGSIVAFPR